MAVRPTPILPEKWCILANTFVGKYVPNKRYLGKNNNLEQETTVTLEWFFEDEIEQKEFFDWWIADVDNGGSLFYAKLPLFADNKHYLFAQNAPLVQSVYPKYTISVGAILFLNKTMQDTMPPLTRDVGQIVEEFSQNNVILLDIEDVDSTDLQIEITNDDANISLKGQSVVYTPPAGFSGTKVYSYRAYDGQHWSNVSTITLEVIDLEKPIAHSFTIHIEDGGNDNMIREVALNAWDPLGKPLTYALVGVTPGVTLPDPNVPLVVIDISAHNSNYNFHYTASNIAKTSITAVATVILDPIPHVEHLINAYPLSVRMPDGCVTGDILEGTLNFTQREDSKGNTLVYTATIGGTPNGTFTETITNNFDIRLRSFDNIGSTGVTLTINVDNGLTNIDRVISMIFDDMRHSDAYQQATLYMIDVVFDGVNREILLPFNTLLDSSGSTYAGFNYIYPAGVIRMIGVINHYGADVTASIVGNRLNVQVAVGASLGSADSLGLELGNCNGDTWYVPVRIMRML